MKKINLGIIGCGHWGPNYVRNFSAMPEARVVWVSDLKEERLAHIKQLFPGVKVSRDCNRLINDNSLDAVVIATPTVTHYRMAMRCLRAGKHVLVEKPMTTAVKEAEILLDLASKRKKTLMVGHTFTYNSAVQTIKELITQDKLGRLYYLYSSRTNLGPLRSDVNVLWDLAPHDVSMFSYLLSCQPVKVSAQGASYLRKGIEDVVFITLYFPHNIIAGIHLSWLNPRKVRELTIVGNKKMLVFDDLNSANPIFLYSKGVIRKQISLPYYDSFREFQYIIRDGDVTTPKVAMKEPLAAECRHFLDCIMAGKEPHSSGRDGLSVVRVLSAIQNSLEDKGHLKEVR
ncbi:MAG: Gfo/Idh/MocA family oxidoreductase [Candidatus Omnitrophica bacterium]|nr:Gfo/Idh/MocA family oxidoreductase [Candidatus Omnitrophota bacterium]